ncbi:hypothetical protein BDV95DRAFT_312762 [Massariosphaeria phaeospora]|uniref:Uncharacterized protein n=1 Tax=Massariosphaeria phaeospora TaxID=100035 RepID=A0A7C8MDX1_9PLEO|nr:hypothetical protein BDV95DRAFT_312762 [Massariosphaeria phaeospora]
MAAPSSPRPTSHAAEADGRPRQHRSSSLASFANSNIESPRTLCPRDGDAFSYNPSHLAAWYISQDLWDSFPAALQKALAHLQHSGAAVLSGYERLESHAKNAVVANPQRSEFEAQLHGSIANMATLPPLKLPRTSSNASSGLFSDAGSLVFDSSPSSGAGSPMTPLTPSHTTYPVSPICLTPADVNIPDKPARTQERSQERSFTTPLEPHDAYYTSELSALRTESVTRLRHSVIKVNTEWAEAQRSGRLSAKQFNDFTEWWKVKKEIIRELDSKCQRLCKQIDLAPNGLGWTV